MKLSVKLPVTLVVGVLVLFSAFSLILFELYRREGVAVLKKNVEYELDVQVREMELMFNQYIYSIKSTANTIKEFETIPEDSRRLYLMKLLETFLLENPLLSATWIMSDAGVIDSFDSQYANTEYGNDLGKFNPIIYVDKESGYKIAQTEEKDFYGDYWTIPTTTKHLYITPPYFYEYSETNKVFMISFCYPVTEKLVIGFDIPIENIVRNIAAYKPMGLGYTFLTSDTGVFISHPKTDLVGKSLAAVDPEYNERYKIIDSMKSHETIGFEKLSSATKVLSYTLFKPFSMAETPLQWYVAFSVPMSILQDKMNTILDTMLLFLLGGALIQGALIYFITRGVVRRLTSLSGTFKAIASGSGDLTQKIAVRGKDEISLLSTSFNTFVDQLRQIVLSLRDGVRMGEDVAENLGAAVEQTAAAINEIIANIASIQKQIDTVDGSIARTSQQVTSITTGINTLEKDIATQASMVEESSAAITEMMSSLSSVSSITEKKTEGVVALKNSALKGKDQLEHTNQTFFETVVEKMGAIQEMAKAIEDISSQTNILSMNAAIEAAHAGEYGKGFAVVAAEIRSLADTSSRSSKTISQTIYDVMQGVAKTKESADKTSVEFDTILHEVNDTMNSLIEISANTKELTVGGREIIKAIEELNTATVNIRNGIQEIARSAESISKEQIDVSNVSTSVAAGTEEIRVGSQEIGEAMQAVTELNQGLREAISKIRAEAEKFKV